MFICAIRWTSDNELFQSRDLDSGRPSQKLDLKTFDGLSIGVEYVFRIHNKRGSTRLTVYRHLLGQSSHAVEAANQSDEASSAEPRESRE